MSKQSNKTTKVPKKDKPFTIQQKKVFAERFKAVLKKISDKNYDTEGIKGINRQRVVEDFITYSGGMEISEQSISHYSNGKRLPQIDMFLGIVNYCEHFIPNFNADYLLGVSEGLTKENHDVNAELGLDNVTIEKIKRLKDSKLKCGRKVDIESNLIPPFSLLINAPRFEDFLKALLEVMSGNVFLLAFTGGRAVELEKLSSYTGWQLENIMKECLADISSYRIELDEDGRHQGIKIIRNNNNKK